MRRHLITALKLVLVAALMVFVFQKINWSDSLVYYRTVAHTEAESEVPGKIVGPWNAEVVAFAPDRDEEDVQEVERGLQEDGRKLEVVVGFLTYWRNLNPWLFAAGALCFFLTVLIASTRWWWLLRVNQLSVTWFETVRFSWIGIFFNSVFLGQTGGDLPKALYIMKHCPGGRVPALVSVVVDRVLGLGSLAILGAVVVLFSLDRFPELALAIWGVMVFVGLLGVVAFSKRVRRAIRLNELLEKLPARFSGLLKRVDQAVYFYRSHKLGIGVALLAGVGNHIVSILSVVLIGNSLGVGMPTMEYFVLIPIINIVSAVPIAPNGWGVGEAMYGYLFSTYGAVYVTGVAAEQAAQIMGTRGVALSVLYRLHLTLWSMLGGLAILFEKDRVTRADVAHEVEIEEREAAGEEV